MAKLSPQINPRMSPAKPVSAILTDLPAKEGLMKNLYIGIAMATASLAFGGCNKAGMTANSAGASSNNAASTSSGDPVTSAESAAPASISHNASIVTMDAKGKMTTVRKGTNGWTCLPDSPTTPGPDPMCADVNATKWAVAWINHKPPPAGATGLMYMLEGGTDASNTDPYATKPTAQNDWVKTGPHVMVVGSKEILAGYPADAKDTSQPYVMWSGTPYAHLMIPITK
jgi:hypothetical protein